MTDNSDPDRVGTFVRWRIAFYAAGDVTALHNLMYLLDGWWTYSFKDKPQRENVHLHPHINVDIDATWDNLEYQACLFPLPAALFPVGVSSVGNFAGGKGRQGLHAGGALLRQTAAGHLRVPAAPGQAPGAHHCAGRR